jgi:TRAP-type C4-dicarboxylate transport system permease small subunit
MRPTARPSARAFFTWVFLIFFAGAADRVYLFLDWSYDAQIWVYRVLVVVLPLVVFVLTRRIVANCTSRIGSTTSGRPPEAEASAAPSVAPVRVVACSMSR